MQIALNRASPQPLYAQLAQDIQGRIRSGALPPGARLPTVRELARQLGVTRLTIHSAYSELQSGGWVEATVVDHGPAQPPHPPPTSDRLSSRGRGLWLLDCLVDEVRVERVKLGTRVTLRRRIRSPSRPWGGRRQPSAGRAVS